MPQCVRAAAWSWQRAAERSTRHELASLGVGREQAAPLGLALPALEGHAILGRPAVEVVIGLGAENEGVHEGGAKEQVLNRFQRTEPQEIPDPTGAVVADAEAPALARRVDVADDLDLVGPADAKPGFV